MGRGVGRWRTQVRGGASEQARRAPLPRGLWRAGARRGAGAAALPACRGTAAHRRGSRSAGWTRCLRWWRSRQSPRLRGRRRSGAREWRLGRAAGRRAEARRRAPAALAGRSRHRGVCPARSLTCGPRPPSHSPVPWSIRMPRPNLAAGWMSTANTCGVGWGGVEVDAREVRPATARPTCCHRCRHLATLRPLPGRAGPGPGARARPRTSDMRLCSAQAMTLRPRCQSSCAMRCACAGGGGALAWIVLCIAGQAGVGGDRASAVPGCEEHHAPTPIWCGSALPSPAQPSPRRHLGGEELPGCRAHPCRPSDNPSQASRCTNRPLAWIAWKPLKCSSAWL